ncbi:ABC transporter substrate-binding protein [Terrarubrum flagellatum]|uniref:ABC transporter substrate-binding protein n=1 Tax=Terrirubrum flagellatum TaxID=2895980 RepID=UPI00314511B3
MFRPKIRGFIAAAAMLAASTSFASADITVGFMTGYTGPGASIGIPYGRGIAAAMAYLDTIGGQKIKLVQMDDGGDPSAAARNTRKMIEEEKVDILIGTSGAPGTLAMAAVAVEQKTPMIAISPIPPVATGDGGPWVVSIPQPPTLMVSAVVEQMKKNGVKTVGYIGFTDAWGDLVYDALMKAAEPAGIKVLTNERYARADTTVTAQTLKIIAARPDAVMTGGAGTPGALPFLALKERGYRGPIYGTHALINPDFIRVGGAAVEGVLAPTGPVIVAEQLPDSNPIKKISMDFRAAHLKANNMPATDAFSAYSFDGWLVFADAAKRALANAQPGTPEFRAALRAALFTTKDVVGTHGVYTYTPAGLYGLDERARVMVTLEKGQWKLMQ